MMSSITNNISSDDISRMLSLLSSKNVEIKSGAGVDGRKIKLM